MGNRQLCYIFEYELGALAAFLVIILRFFFTRRFPNQKNLIYSVIMWATVADIVFDVLSAKTIEFIFVIPQFYTYLTNTLYYSVTVLIMMLMTAYTISLTGPIDKKRMRQTIPLFIPGAAILLLLACNHLTHLFFYIDPVFGYTRAPAFSLGYAVCLLYMAATLIITLLFRKAMKTEEYFTILLFLAVAFGAMVIQYLMPEYLITGIALVVSVMLMYFTIQKPDSMVDTTTGAFTYDAMLSFLNDRKNERGAVGFLAVKVNNMSRINELLGIENGSLLLKKVCQNIQGDNNDIWVFRMRGSCFVALTYKKDVFKELCGRLMQRIDQVWAIGSTEVLLHATVCTEADDMLDTVITPEDIINYIDTALILGQQSVERITVISAGVELVEESKRRKAVELAMRESLAADTGFELYLQPIWSIGRKKFVSAEVLLRFFHPALGSISPNEFVPIAENCGLVTELDEMVVRKACRMIAESGLYELGIERLEINLSALEFMHRRLPDMLHDIMTRYSVNPSGLCFEITETAAIESFEVLRDCMNTIRELGCIFALDDFGTGYSNISKVFNLPFEIIKMDKSLLYDSNHFLGDLARVFKRSNRQVLVEGVETGSQAEQLSSCDIDYIQGYYYAKPMDKDSFVAFLREHTHG